MEDSGRAKYGNASGESASPISGKKKTLPSSPGSRSRYQVSAPGHCFKKVTLTKPTFCHNCSDFIWGLVGFICEVCNFMCHERCLKTIQTVCSCVAPSMVKFPVAHCFGPAGQKKKFCSVCRKHTEGNAALRCEVCELYVHTDCAIFSCGDCRLCHHDDTGDSGTFHHHWREGNLVAAARCDVCRRTCGSADVLAGLRCGWCGLTAHAACCGRVPPDCHMGGLRGMTLPPSAVRLCSRNFSKMHCYRISESYCNEMDISDEVDTPKETTTPSTSDSGKQTLRVFDGDDAVKRGAFRILSLSRSEDALEAALRAFYLPDEPERYELLKVGGQQSLLTDDFLNRNGTPPDNKSISRDCPPEAWLIRAKPQETEILKIYVDGLKDGVAYTSVSVSCTSTVDSVIQEVLTQLGRQEEDASQFNLMEVHMGSKQVLRQALVGQELVLDKLQEIRKTSLRQMNQTRLCLTVRVDQVVQVKLLLGGLPLQLTEEEYRTLLEEHLAPKGHLVTMTHTYGSQGAVALEISCFLEAERIYMLARDTTVNNKALSVVVVPDILRDKLDRNASPLLVLVNPKSGGLKGRELLHGFRKLLNPHQVFDMTNGGPLAGLHTVLQVPRFRVLVCGGDGTVGWVLGVLEAIRHKLSCPEPPIAIVPLGTGNDLSRVLRWGGGYSGEDPQQVLVSVDEADEVQMDRWTILLDALDLSQDTAQQQGFLEPPKIVQMNNYFGLGIDAEVSLDFHHAREEEPGKFNSRFHNKGVYLKVGLQKLSHNRSLHKDLKLQVDKQDVELPSIEGLILLNIPSWGSGADLWGSEADSRYSKPRIDDGMLEVVGVTGVGHMGQVQSGLRSGIRIAQGNYVRITVTKPIPVQVDGEPWIQSPGHIIISAAGPKVRMLKKSKHKQKKQQQPASLQDGRSEATGSCHGGH